jgi:hypothetical protein
MSWRAADSPEAIDALSMQWDFKLAYLFSPIPLLKRVVKKLELSRGVFLLVTPYWEFGRPRLGSPAFRCFKFWKSVVFPSTTTSSSTCQQGSPLHLWSGSSWSFGRSAGVLGSQRRFGQVLQAYRGRMEAILRRPLRKGLAVLQSFPARFLRSSPSSDSEDGA